MKAPKDEHRRWLLASLLTRIKENDRNYNVRYALVFEAVVIALRLGYKAGIGVDEKEPDWPVLYIELPTGQVSWHMPKHEREWDGHDTLQKFARMNQWIEEYA